MDVGSPVEVSIRWLELRREHHRAAVDRIDTDRAVIAPACEGSGLNAAAHQNGRLVAERSQWIGWTTIRITNARNDARRIRDVVADGDAARLIDSGTTHPAEVVRRRERALLADDRRCAGHRLPDRVG